MQVKELLIAGRKIIEDEKNWTQGSYATDADGGWTPVDSERAVCFCSLGALRKAIVNEGIRQWPCDINYYSNAVIALNRLSEENDIAEFNDTHTHEEVLAAFDKAIAST